MKTFIIITCVILLAVGKIYTSNAENVQKNLLNLFNHYNSETFFGKSCPDLKAISPCFCGTLEDGVTMDCSNVTTELELQSIFAKPFPENDMNIFFMDQKNINSSIGELPHGVFGSKTFRKVQLWNINFNSGFNSFTDMNSTLHNFFFHSALIKKVNHNFNDNAVLTDVVLKYCPLIDFLISSPTLEVLGLFHTNIIERPDNKPYLVGTMPNLRKLYMVYGNLHKMPDTSGYPKLTHVYIYINHISSIDVSQRTENYLDVFSAGYNDFQDIPVDSIRMSENSSFYMYNNKLQSLEQEKWRNIFLNASLIWLQDNPLNCSCVMAWLFGKDAKGTPFIEKMFGTETCDDGVLLTDLDPYAYEIC